MPIYDFRCTRGHVHEALVPIAQRSHECPECDANAERVLLAPPKLTAWNDPTRFERVHKQHLEKEKTFHKEHGDYLRTPGG